MFKEVLHFLVFLLAFVGLTAQTPVWQWAVKAGSSENDEGYAIALDSLGNQYITGEFSWIIGFGTTMLTSAGDNDIIVAKLDSSGNWLWAVRAGGTSGDSGSGVSVDEFGCVIVTGHYNGNADFGPFMLASNGITSFFVAKLDSAGNWLWAVRADGISEDIAVDSAGSALLTGYFFHSASIGPFTLTANESIEIFVAKIDSSGNWLWAVRAGGPYIDMGLSITLDCSGNSWITGFFYYSADFGPYSITSIGERNLFIAKLDSGGNWLWVIRAGGESSAISLDCFGNAYLTGYLVGSADFGPYTLTSTGSHAIFVAKLDSDGNWLWAVRDGETSGGYSLSISTDSMGNPHLTGYFLGSNAFGPITLTSNGGPDIFVASLDSAGNWLWAQSAGGISNDVAYSIDIDSAGNSYLTGCFAGSAAFGPYTITSSGDWDVFDIFVAKLSFGTPVEDDFSNPAPNLFLSASPNPFAATTAITVTGREPDSIHEKVVIDIYDLRGRKVRHLTRSNFTQGDVIVLWDGRDEQGIACSTGVYLARLDLIGRIATLKLTLTK